MEQIKRVEDFVVGQRYYDTPTIGNNTLLEVVEVQGNNVHFKYIEGTNAYAEENGLIEFYFPKGLLEVVPFYKAPNEDSK